MKKLSMIILTMLSFSSFAHTYVGMNVPTMLMKNGFEFESVKVTNICQLEDGSFKTINKATNKCVKYSRRFRNANEYRDANNGCLRTGSLHLFAAESKPTAWCAEYGREDGEYGCTRIGHGSEVRPLSYTVQKVRWNTRGGMNRDSRVIDEVLESYTHTIPACK